MFALSKKGVMGLRCHSYRARKEVRLQGLRPSGRADTAQLSQTAAAEPQAMKLTKPRPYSKEPPDA